MMMMMMMMMTATATTTLTSGQRILRKGRIAGVADFFTVEHYRES